MSPCVRFKRGFESEPTLHSGINYAVLLLAAGHQFDTSFELRKVGEATTVFLEMHSQSGAFMISGDWDHVGRGQRVSGRDVGGTVGVCWI